MTTGKNESVSSEWRGHTMRCQRGDAGTEGRLTEVSPVGQGLEGSVHVAGVAYVLQPRQA